MLFLQPVYLESSVRLYHFEINGQRNIYNMLVMFLQIFYETEQSVKTVTIIIQLDIKLKKPLLD